MTTRRLALAAATLTFISTHHGSAQDTIPLTSGMVITRSVTISRAPYVLPASADLKTPAITIRGDSITVDFNGAELAGAGKGQDPNTFAGVGILIDGGSKVTVRNAVVRGYKVGTLARKSPGLHLTGNDVSHNWKQRLYSGIEKESLVDWMSYHQNEQVTELKATRFRLLCSYISTHGGDGLFLWAGQSTMDSGQGGSNDNVFYKNDFSHAPANGIEATFSRNEFVENRIEECWHGVWGGYSWESAWINNRFARNAEGIAIEHGQNNVIAGNLFDGDATGIRLWQNASQDPNWGYPKNRDTRSRGYRIYANEFRNTIDAFDIRDTADVGFTTPPPPAPDLVAPRLTPLDGGIDPTIKEGERRGRHTIIVDEWGPYDWKSPKLWPVAKPDESPLRLRVLGPEGEWKVVSVTGATVSQQAGRVPGAIDVVPRFGPGSKAPSIVDFDVTLEYRGAAVTSPRGEHTPAGSPYRFSYSHFFVPILWQVRFFEYGEAADPVKQPDAFAKLLTGKPLKQVYTDRLDYISGRTIEDGVPRDRFAFTAEGTVTMPAGEYVLQVISDDGVRVWVDDELIIDDWQPHESKVDRVRIAGGNRRFKVQYYEVGGFAELRFNILRR